MFDIPENPNKRKNKNVPIWSDEKKKLKNVSYT